MKLGRVAYPFLDDSSHTAGEEERRTVSLHEASAQLAELVPTLEPGDQVVLTDGGRVNRIVLKPAAHPHPRAGVCRGVLEVVDDGEDAILDHFRDCLS